MANFFIKRPIFAIVVALVITIAGALCIFSLPIDRYPKITPPQVSVHATYPGADSEVVAQTVAEVIEKNVVGAEGFDNMSSTSNSNGSYSLSVQFLTGTDSDMATIRVQNGVTAADAGLPDTVRSIGVSTKKSSGDMALVVGLLSPNGTYDDVFLKNYFSMNYLDELKSIKGVGNVQEFGSTSRCASGWIRRRCRRTRSLRARSFLPFLRRISRSRPVTFPALRSIRMPPSSTSSRRRAVL